MRFNFSRSRNTLLILASLTPAAVQAADVSLVSGLYKKSSDKVGGQNAGSTSEFAVMGRFHDDLGDSLAWFAEGGLGMNSYTAADGRTSPDNSVSLEAGGGVRHYFKPFGTAVVPYGAVSASVRNSKTVDWNSAGYTETTNNGLFYGAAIGIRAGLDSNFFAELELPLFDSALFAVAKKVTVTETATGKTESKTETTRNELWVASSANIAAARIGVGYKF